MQGFFGNRKSEKDNKRDLVLLNEDGEQYQQNGQIKQSQIGQSRINQQMIGQNQINQGGQDMIQPRNQGSNFANHRQQRNNISDFVDNGNQQALAESIYVPQGSSHMNESEAYQCRCGTTLTDRNRVIEHARECFSMQNDGLSQFVLSTTSIMKIENQNQQLTQGQKVTANKLRALFNICVPNTNQMEQQIQAGKSQKRISQISNHVDEEMKVPHEDVEMFNQINSCSKPNENFNPPYMEKSQSHNSKAGLMNMDDFMDPSERKRAQTYYEQVKKDAEERMCKFCDKQITDQDMAQSLMTMLQSSECFHQVHIECLKERTIKLKSENQQVQCPKCNGSLQDFELNQFLSDEDKLQIEKSQQMQIVKLNPSFVCCQCGNVMELIPGEIQKGLKDDRGKPLTQDASIHMSKNRIRCHQCTKNFCASCNCEPYHTGKTCDEHQARSCRYCQEKLTQPSPSMKTAFRDVCRKSECFEAMQSSCDKMHQCGHPCYGSVGEKQCLPCLHKECIEKLPDAQKPKKDADEYCTICYCSSISQEPSVALKCGHIFHLNCIRQQVQKQWNGPRIVFNYLDCPDCKQRIDAPHCPALDKDIQKELKFEKIVVDKCMQRAKFENFEKHERVQKPGDRFYGKLKEFALHKLSYYMCFKCQDPYFGGMKDCEAGQNDYNNFKKEELVCGKCAAVCVGGGQKLCKTHGTDFIEFKCKFCCSIAQWFCWGNTHFCEVCHKRQCSGDYVSRKTRDQLPKCPGKSCPSKGNHPPNGEEYALGCSVCRNLSENQKNF